MRGKSLVAAGGLVLLAAGCATTGGDQMANSVYATHRIVQKLDTDMSARVDKLNQTAADLSAKVDASDQATRQLQSMMEENQAKLNALQKNLDRLAQVMYRSVGVTPGPTGSVDVGGARIEPPEGTVPGALPPPATPPATAEAVPANPAVTPPVAEDPAGATADYKKASEVYMNDNFQEALTLYGDFLQKYPNSDYASSAQYWKARCFQGMGQWEQAVREFDSVKTSYPMAKKVPPAMYYQAECYLRLGQQQRAIDLLKDLSSNPRYSTDAMSEQARDKLKELQG